MAVGRYDFALYAEAKGTHVRQVVIAGNWKMNGTRQGVSKLLDALVTELKTNRKAQPSLSLAEIAVIPPAIFLPVVEQKLSGTDIRWGGQDISEHQKGAYTGEIAGSMLTDFGCTYTLVGHSERRQWFGDTDARTLLKVKQALALGLTPILCVGEMKAERENNQAEAFVARQLNVVISALDEAELAQIVVAYEPVWAIGTGLTAAPDQAQAMHLFIRATVAEKSAKLATELRILYGGSANTENAATLLAEPDIDGLLVGGASLDAGAFMSICRQADESIVR